jgi:tRNA A-37 threonylcarbamoyl transferase component Bud32/membrane-associated phospholipid phosphatase
MLGERRRLSIAGIRFAGRRRRPSGEMAPLPRELSTAGRFWLIAGLGVIAVWVSLFAFPTTTSWWTDRDMAVLEWIVELRTAAGISIAEAFHGLGAEWVVRGIRIAMLVALVAVRRWRHVFAVLLAIAVVGISVERLAEAIGRVRPGVEIVGSWSGPSHPSAPVAALAVTLMAGALSLVPKGRYRAIAIAIGGVLVALNGTGRIYLGADHPSDVLASALYAPAVTFMLFTWFAPQSVFPVTWRRRVKAHLDVSGARGVAVRRAIREQLGVAVLAIEPFRLEVSSSSTPLRLRVAAAAGGEAFLFAKLYSQTHLNSDRWYKVGRSILYGSLEDEVRFTSVRRLVEYEDYIHRVMSSCRVPSAAPIAVVEITPEREYLLVSEFLTEATEITETDLTPDVIDDALAAIRGMWDAGLAHRDIKPSNVMVSEGEVVLIDFSFGMVRPTPWRQAVDLANMMLLLALSSDVATVYERALRQFAPTDIAEAFAATRSVTIPRQTRSLLAALKRDRGLDLVKEFQDITPEREPIAIQRWSARRLWRTAAAASAAAFLLAQVWAQIRGRGLL